MADDPLRSPEAGRKEGLRSGPEKGPGSAASGWSRILRLALGWFLVGLGIVGLFLPVLQGVLLLSLGLLVLSRESPALRRLGRRLGDRFPFLRRIHDRMQRAHHSAGGGEAERDGGGDGSEGSPGSEG